MSRRPRDQQQFKQEMQYLDYEEDDDFDDYEDWELDLIESLAIKMGITTHKATEVLEKYQFDEERATQKLQEERQAKRLKEQAKLKKKEEHQKKLEEQRLQKQMHEEKLMKKTSDSGFQRTKSIEPTCVRKSSTIVEEYDKDHYNEDYPDLQVKKKIQPSRTVNIVVVGHVDSGKSTLVGKLMHMIEEISKKQIQKNEKISKQMGRQSFKYAWVTDETEEERVRGVTIDVGVKKIILKDRNIVFLDSPGHRDFIPNMITGAAQADYAILVIDVTHFDSTFVNGGQTKEHAYIVKSLGVQTIIVAVNKMDQVQWNPQAFQMIKKKLNYYLIQIGFLEEHVIYLPISAFYGVNIHQGKKRTLVSNDVTYDQTLIEVLATLPLPHRPINKPFRMNITNCYDSPMGKLKGHCLSGKIEGGVITKDSKLVILPQDCQCVVKDILLGNEKVKEASVGDNVDIQVKLIDETYFETIKAGNVLSSLSYSIPVTKKFTMEAMALDLDMPILKGTAVMLYIGSNKATGRITKIMSKYDPKTGAVIKKNCKSIRSNDCVHIQMETDENVCVEKFSNSKIFGRVIIREKKSTLCVGNVLMIE